MKKIFIDGSSGTTGLRIVERLQCHGGLSVTELKGDERKDLSARVKAANAADLVFLCLPDAAAKEIVPLISEEVKICDTSTAHRVADGWLYGFPELGNRREQLKTASRVAIPGCHAGGFLSIIAPLVEKGVLPKEALVSAYSLTGYTGGGKAMIAEYESGERAAEYDAPRGYGLGLSHKHLPEMKAASGLLNTPLFAPIVADYPRGMAVSVPLFASQLAKGKSVWETLDSYYKNEEGITVERLNQPPENGFLAANAMAGSDKMKIFVFEKDENILIISLFDNLGKGASGAAIQCMNIMLGFPERMGLE